MEREPGALAVFRTAGTEDAAALTQLINRAFEVERPIFGGDRIDSDGVLEYMQRGKFLIAEDAAGLAGCVYAEVRGATGYIGLLSVEPARQGTGLGRQLMQAVEDLFRKAGCSAAELRVVSARTPLPGFYRHLGYSESGIEALPATMKAKVPCHLQYMRKKLV